jgi:hypothetical protein
MTCDPDSYNFYILSHDSVTNSVRSLASSKSLELYSIVFIDAWLLRQIIICIVIFMILCFRSKEASYIG